MGLAGTLPASLTQLTRLQNLCAAPPPQPKLRRAAKPQMWPVSANCALAADAQGLVKLCRLQPRQR
jgi:hypothetical protein